MVKNTPTFLRFIFSRAEEAGGLVRSGILALVRFGERGREAIRRGGGIALLLAEEERCLVDEDSNQPAFEGAFAAAIRWIVRGSAETVFDRFLGFLRVIEDAAGDEVQQPSIAREPQFEGALEILAGLAVGFERAATDGNVSVIHAVPGSGEECWGGGCHKHACVFRGVSFVMQMGRFAYELSASTGQMKGLG